VQALLEQSARVGIPVSTSAVSQAVEDLIIVHAKLGNSSEIAWALWLTISAASPISSAAAVLIGNVDDCFVALLALHARSLGLIPPSLPTALWQQAMSRDELMGSRWLLSYEARQQGWLLSNGKGDHRIGHSLFEPLSAAGISFYDLSAAAAAISSSSEIEEDDEYEPFY
jgi:hypothetical protein